MYLQNSYPSHLKTIVLSLEKEVPSRMLNERSLKVRPFLEEIKHYTKWMDHTVRFTQRVHAIKNDVFQIPKCPRCGTEVNFQNEHKHYHIYCSRKCMLGSGLLSKRSIDHWEQLPEDEKERRRLRCIELMNDRSHRYSSKLFTFPIGRIVRVQGTEPTILSGLLDYFDESDILVGRDVVPIIFYNYNGKQHRHYPDIFVKSKNLLIDAKSNWTYYQNLEINHTKQDTARSLGFEYWFAFG